MDYQELQLIGAADAGGNAWLEARNPARPAEVVGRFPDGTPDDVDRAVRAAQAAYPGWRALSLPDRVALLSKAADNLQGVTDSIAPLLTREMGKVVAESYADAMFSQLILRSVGADAEQVLAPATIADDEYGRVLVERVPVGVVGAIVPWNWPLGLLIGKFAAAAAAGNTVVCVPSPYATLAVVKMVRAIAAALPPGVINVVTGAGASVGSALVSHPLVRAVAFTGGTETGRSVLSAGSSTLTIPTLELGGNDAAILLDDVEVTESLAAQLMAGALVTSGQVCFAVKRIYAPDSLVADLVEACGQVMSATVVGDGLEPGNTMGPLANKSQFARALAFLDEARTKGAQILTHGQRGAGYSDEGYFMQPSLLTGIDETFGVVRDEQFAPLVPIMGYREQAEAVRRANDTEFGLSSSVWSPDLERARSVARQMEAGTTYINQHDMMAVNMSAPMGGVKHSGLGREQGAYAFAGFTELHQINDRRVPMPQA